ncbi:hypothetical protein KXS11_09185 [Plantibacter flavus]|uniref:hypothetical protein n=1 Tax=Plantibacter flavus TaxID=150123 RepID=UPI003F159A2C
MQTAEQPRSTSGARIVVIGDEFLGRTDWDTWFRPAQVLDLRGTPLTPGELPILTSVLAFVDTHTVILTTGSIDGTAGIVDLTSSEATVDAFAHVLSALRTALPQARLVLQALPPADRAHARIIRETNALLQRLCESTDVGFLPLWEHFAQHDGSMNPDLVVPSGDLNANGFETWIEMLDHEGVLPSTDRPRRLPSPHHIYRAPEHTDVAADAPSH